MLCLSVNWENLNYSVLAREGPSFDVHTRFPPFSASKSALKYTLKMGLFVSKPLPILRTSSEATRTLMEAESGIGEVRIKLQEDLVP